MEVTRGDFRACAEKTEKSLCSKGSLEINRCVILSIRYWTIAQIRSCTQIQSLCQSISKTPWLLQLQCCAVEDVQKAGSKVLAWSQLASAHPREQLPPHVSKYLHYLPPTPRRLPPHTNLCFLQGAQTQFSVGRSLSSRITMCTLGEEFAKEGCCHLAMNFNIFPV